MHRDSDPLLPPIGAIHERLTRNQRERKLLRDLLRLAVRASDEAVTGQVTPEPRRDRPRPAAAAAGVGRA